MHFKIDTNIKLSEIDSFLLSKCNLSEYQVNFNKLRMRHPSFKKGWYAEFMSPHRFLNRIVFKIICDNFSNSKVLDYGCYDGVLVKCLIDAGFDAYGFESLMWDSMYELLGIRDRISITPVDSEIIVCLNYAHRIEASKFVDSFKSDNIHPKLIFLDRCPTNPPCRINGYFDEDLIKSLGFSVLKFPNCNITDDSVAQLLIWQQ